MTRKDQTRRAKTLLKCANGPCSRTLARIPQILRVVHGGASEVEGVSVRILNHKLGDAPRTFGDAFDDLHAGFLHLPERALDVAHGEMDVKVLPAPHEVDARVGGIHQFEVDHPLATADTSVEVLVAKGEYQAKLRRVEVDRAFEVRGAELRYEFDYLQRLHPVTATRIVVEGMLASTLRRGANESSRSSGSSADSTRMPPSSGGAAGHHQRPGRTGLLDPPPAV